MKRRKRFNPKEHALIGKTFLSNPTWILKYKRKRTIEEAIRFLVEESEKDRMNKWLFGKNPMLEYNKMFPGIIIPSRGLIIMLGTPMGKHECGPYTIRNADQDFKAIPYQNEGDNLWPDKP